MADEEVWRLANLGKGQDVRGGSGKGRSSLSAGAKARLARIVAKRPEVMVRITGRTRGIVHLKAHLDYVSRSARLEVERSDGVVIRDRTGMRLLHDDWLQANAVMARGRSSPQAVQSVSVILSMPPGNPPDKVQAAARSWARDTFADRHEWIMARHDDKDHPHVHVTVRAVGADGRRLTAGPKELQAWRERFAGELRRYGIEAEATPRQARGLVRKADSMAMHKIERRGAVPWVRQAATRKAEQEASAAEPRARQGWQATIGRRQEGIRRAYLAHAVVLGTSEDPADRQLGADVERFVTGLPLAATRRQAVAAELRAVTSERVRDHDALTVAPPLVSEPRQPTMRRRR